MRTATREEWNTIVANARACGAPNAAAMLEAGSITFVTKAGEELSAPFECKSAPTMYTAPVQAAAAPVARSSPAPAVAPAKRWGELTTAERIALWNEDEDHARALRDADEET